MKHSANPKSWIRTVRGEELPCFTREAFMWFTFGDPNDGVSFTIADEENDKCAREQLWAVREGLA